MNDLRTQLHVSREAYKTAAYSGDLADLLPAAPSRWNLADVRSLARIAAVAGFVLVSVTVAFVAGNHQAGARSAWQALIPSRSELPPLLPARTQMAGAVKELTPPPVPGLLKEAKQPLMSSGLFIVNIGKDIAHHADALFHMG